MKKIIAKNTISQLVGKVIGAGTAFVVSLVVARQFGAVGYGEFTKITTYVAFFFLIADFGLNAIYLQKFQEKSMWETLLGLRIIGGILLIFLSLGLLAFFPQGTSQGYTSFVRFGIMIFSPAILFQGLITSANAIFQKYLRYDLATIAIAAGSAVTLAVLFLPVTRGSLGGVIAILAGSVGTALIGLWLTRTFIPTHRIVFQPSYLARLFLPTIPLGLTLLFNLVYFRADSVILTLTRSTTEVGIYGLAYKVFEVPLVVPTFFMNAVYPLLLKRTHNVPYILRQSFLVLSIGSVITAAALWLGAPLLSVIRSDFAASVDTLRVLSVGLPFFFLSAITMWALIARKKQGILAVIYACLMVFNIAVNMWLIPVYGYIAAAWTTVLSEALVFAISGIAFLSYLR